MELDLIILIGIIFIILFVIGIIYFYRYPHYNENTYKISGYVNDSNILYSPAHGVISDIIVNEETGITLVSIFLNVYDVHHQYSPCAGIVEKLNYNKGKFNPAGYFNKTRDNENMEITIKRENGDIINVKQIAGILVRVIETVVKENEEIKQGQYLGMIKFGSRVDISFPTKNYKLLVKEGQRVEGLDDKIAEHVQN